MEDDNVEGREGEEPNVEVDKVEGREGGECSVEADKAQEREGREDIVDGDKHEEREGAPRVIVEMAEEREGSPRVGFDAAGTSTGIDGGVWATILVLGDEVPRRGPSVGRSSLSATSTVLAE